jgi:hypothetical protein
MTACNVQKCLNPANETLQPLPIVGPLCDEHRARVLAVEDYEVQGSEESATGTAQPTVLMGDSLLALDQYVLLEAPTKISVGRSRHGHLVPLRVKHRGESSKPEFNLVIPPDMLPAVANLFQPGAER